MNKRIFLLLFLALLLVSCSLDENGGKVYVIDNASFGIYDNKTNARATTDGINAAIDAAYKAGYTAVLFTPGDYLITCENPLGWDWPDDGIFLRSKTAYDLGGARFYVEPTDNHATAVFQLERIENVTISGGEIIGDMKLESGQYGSAFNLMSCENIIIKNMKMRSLASVAIRVSGYGDFYLYQTMFNDNIRITGCEFEYCGWEGINLAHVVNAEIDNNRFINFPADRPGNHWWGMSGIRVLRYGTDRCLQNIKIHDNYFEQCGAAIIVSSAEDVEIYDNRVKEITGVGIGISDCHRVRVHRNTIENPGHPITVTHNMQGEWNEDIWVPEEGPNKNDAAVDWNENAEPVMTGNFPCEP
ncbi:MAG: right-handed parallel beta-helix repeat-containing protein [Spirochaetaceae bacterium]|jgi:hypothetical protein|nr:right-handed parallel beta-helix repeat-containing protein [Spirochaetaceae bacterium]